MAVATSPRSQLAWFVDAAVELLSDKELRMTPLTQMDWKGVDRALCDRILWDLADGDYPGHEKMTVQQVAEKHSVNVSLVERLKDIEQRLRTQS